jgi:hypothetical protein
VTPQALLDRSAHAEQAALGIALLLAVLLVIRGWRRFPRLTSTSASWDAALTPGRELLCLLAIFAAAVAVRVVGWNRALTAPHWFAQTTTLVVAEILERGDWWARLRELLGTYQGPCCTSRPP